ncbi:hypothetical protein D3C81_1618880 [compost metagenome]
MTLASHLVALGIPGVDPKETTIVVVVQRAKVIGQPTPIGLKHIYSLLLLAVLAGKIIDLDPPTGRILHGVAP